MTAAFYVRLICFAFAFLMVCAQLGDPIGSIDQVPGSANSNQPSFSLGSRGGSNTNSNSQNGAYGNQRGGYGSLDSNNQLADGYKNQGGGGYGYQGGYNNYQGNGNGIYSYNRRRPQPNNLGWLFYLLHSYY